MAKEKTVVIEDAWGNSITMANGKITIKSVSILELKAPVILVNGRSIAASNNPI
jgi:hypothetical protein